jgi:hypothetical protein
MAVEKDFPQPLSGRLICEDGQTAVIKIDNGIIIAACVSPPSGVTVQRGGRLTQEYKKFVALYVTEQDGWPFDELTPTEQRILALGRHVISRRDGTRVEVYFQLTKANWRPEGGGRVMMG